MATRALVWTVLRQYRKLRDRSLTPDGKWLVGAGLVLGIFSLDVTAYQTFVFWSALFGLGLSAVLVGRSRRVRAEVERCVPLKVTAGSLVDYSARVRNAAPYVLIDLEVREEGLPFEIEPTLDWGRGPLTRRLLPGETRRVGLKARFERRGVYDLGALRVERTCPLGLTRYGLTIPCRSRVIVHPRHFAVESVDFTTARVHQPGGVPLSASVGESTEFVGLRDYRSGDPIRHISWKAWARTGEPVVREFQGEYFRRVAVILDTRVRPGAGEGDHFEAAVSVTASITRYFETHEYIIDLFAAGANVYYLQAGTGLARMEDVLDLLACVEPGGEGLPSVDDRLRTLLGRLSGIVLVTTDWWEESRTFYAHVAQEVPEVKVILVRPDRAFLDPECDVSDPRLLRRIDPGRVESEVAEL